MYKTDRTFGKFTYFVTQVRKLMGQLAYLRFREQRRSNENIVLVPKTRGVPSEKLTVPRLELMGALITARMGGYLKNKVFDRTVITLWTDSSIALGWIRGGRKWESFITNSGGNTRNVPSNSVASLPRIFQPPGCTNSRLFG
ncbi:hypothetical protein HPB48_005455 [Haemaphysalis longicornis]|uniref:Uncharacterized protein n=1 Tax=Haemaphysalis longicornis TaxID=44386 RepID=A0A9J6GK29_HAELO|nr:hypothetical protein HPB48_005455 [Haemaphysalis longicornis]